MSQIAVVIGSTRPARICPGIAEWFTRTVQGDSSLTYELLDLADVNLPFLDEPSPAALQRYEHAHTKAWSERVLSYDGFVFVFPQYNWGYPAVLKNALDFLYAEWRDKPASFATYGTRGGNLAANQFHQIIQGLHMQEVDQHLELVITEADLDDDGQLLDIDATLRPFEGAARTVDEQLTEVLEDSQAPV